jgi:hypothetical protein
MFDRSSKYQRKIYAHSTKHFTKNEHIHVIIFVYYLFSLNNWAHFYSKHNELNISIVWDHSNDHRNFAKCPNSVCLTIKHKEHFNRENQWREETHRVWANNLYRQYLCVWVQISLNNKLSMKNILNKALELGKIKLHFRADRVLR